MAGKMVTLKSVLGLYSEEKKEIRASLMASYWTSNQSPSAVDLAGENTIAAWEERSFHSYTADTTHTNLSP